MFELGVGVRQGFVEMEKTEVEAVAYVNSPLRNDSFSAVRDSTKMIPFRL